MIDKARRIAAHQLEAAEEDLEFSDGCVLACAASPDRSKTVAADRLRGLHSAQPPDGIEPRLEASSPGTRRTSPSPRAPTSAWSRSTPRPATCGCSATWPSTTAATRSTHSSCGGRSTAGSRRGSAQALYEEAVYTSAGNLVDQIWPTTSCPPRPSCRRSRRSTVTPSPTNSLGVKGIGEAGTIAAAPAVINAVVDALVAARGHDIDMPATPERVWRASSGAKGGSDDPGEIRLRSGASASTRRSAC